MCRECMKELLPDRSTCALEAGSYVLNFHGCKACGDRSMPLCVDKEREEDETVDLYEETITYNHTCKSCNHIICEHYYKFSVCNNTSVQDYYMECFLCGKGASTTRMAVNENTTQAEEEATDEAEAEAAELRAEQEKKFQEIHDREMHFLNNLATNLDTSKFVVASLETDETAVNDDEWE